MTTFIGHAKGQFEWTGTAPAIYASSPDVTRGFCKTCGSPVFFESTKYPNECHFYAALLENPNAVHPSLVYHDDERLDWMHGPL